MEGGRPDWVSDDGRFRVRFACSSTVGNAYVCQPRLLDGDAVLLDLWSASTWDWDCYDVSAAGGVVTLGVRRFPGSTGATLVVDADAGTYEVRDALRHGKGLDPLYERLRLAGLKPA